MNIDLLKRIKKQIHLNIAATEETVDQFTILAAAGEIADPVEVYKI